MMRKLARLSWTALVLGGGIIASGVALAADRTAEAILTEIESVQMPKLDASKTKRRGLSSRLHRKTGRSDDETVPR